MNFFRTAFALCTKISALDLLKNVSAGRAIFHAFLMLLLCPVLLATIRVCVEKQDVTDTLAQIRTASGGFVFNNGQLKLGNGNDEIHLAFRMLQLDTRLDYTANKEVAKNLDPAQWKEGNGIVVTPEHLFFWMKPGAAEYSILQAPVTMLSSRIQSDEEKQKMTSLLMDQMSSPGLFSASQLKEKATASIPSEAVSGDSKGIELSLAQLRLFLLTLFWSAIFAATLNQCLLLMLMGGLSFALVQYLRFRMLPQNLPFIKVLGLTLYATFPALLIATLISATGQQVFAFQTIFFVVFFIYQLMGFNYLMRQMNPPANNPPPPDDDDDF